MVQVLDEILDRLGELAVPSRLRPIRRSRCRRILKDVKSELHAIASRADDVEEEVREVSAEQSRTDASVGGSARASGNGIEFRLGTSRAARSEI